MATGLTNGLRMGVLIPPIRNEMHAEDRERLKDGIYSLQEVYPDMCVGDVQGGADDIQFRNGALKDGLHYRESFFHLVINCIAEITQLPRYRISDGPLTVEEMFNDRKCERCGRYHPRETGKCAISMYCGRCGSESHMSHRCLYRWYMCDACGIKGHKSSICRSSR